MAEVIWSLKRGEYKQKKVWVRVGVYTPNGKLFFAAKAEYDNDPTDGHAVIKKTMTDDDIIETNDDGDKAFNFVINNSDTQTLNIDGPTDYKAEFQYVNASGQPISYPSGDTDSVDTFTLRIIPDVKVGIV